MIFANITDGQNGYPRLQHGGYTFGRRKVKNHGFEEGCMKWTCTRSAKNKKRCTASVETKIIDGYVMMRVINANHICSN